jgi:hypothetical protein
MRLVPSFTLPMLVACAGAPATPEEACDARACAPTEPALPPDLNADQLTLSEREWELFGPALQDLRLGARPWDDHGIGVCGGAACETFLGLTPDLLPPGKWRLLANLRLPALGRHPWSVTFRQTCEMTRNPGTPEASTTTEDTVQTYEVVWQSETRGALLDPLVLIPSPDPVVHRLCGWDLTASSTPGTTRRWEGAYEVAHIGEVAAAARRAPAPDQAPPEPANAPPSPVPQRPRDAQVPEAPPAP